MPHEDDPGADAETGYPAGALDDADDAIDKARGHVDGQAEEAARRSGYGAGGDSEEVAGDA